MTRKKKKKVSTGTKGHYNGVIYERITPGEAKANDAWPPLDALLEKFDDLTQRRIYNVVCDIVYAEVDRMRRDCASEHLGPQY